ncbi:RNA polymerase [Niabella soli DSM 19437]|uniref:RNA polymerase n=2 Tax=Niabella TaxID=379899 RepID=W0EUU7_9BACT|nr:RNA polymerase [Niabella soli DSM 19437]
MVSTYSYNEPELLRRIAQGDERAFARVVDKYTPVVYPHLLSYLKNTEKAEEIAQDVFLRVWKNRQKLDQIENFPGYVYIITRNRAKSALKELLSDPRQTPIDPLQDLFAHPQSVSVEVKELSNVLGKAIEALPCRRKEVFMLSRMGHFTYEEIADQLGISRSAVRQHMVQALVFLRSYLKEALGIIVSHAGWIILLCDLLLR